MLKEDKEYISGMFQSLAACEKLEKANQSTPSIAAQYKYKKEEIFDNFVLGLLLSAMWGSLFDYLNVLMLISTGRERFGIFSASKEQDDITNIENSFKEISKFNLELFSGLK